MLSSSKLVQVVLDLAAAKNLEAQVGEDAVDLPHRLCGDVQPAALHRPARQRHVERIGGQASLSACSFSTAGRFS